MNQAPPNGTEREAGRSLSLKVFRRRTAAAAALVVLVLGATLLFFNVAYESRLGPRQPVAFSHRVHATDKTISCLVCHDRAPWSRRAGIPALETCMLCHLRIIVSHPQIRKVRDHYFENVPLEWVKVAGVPDFTFFDHSAHLRRAVDCGHCHGDVARMDRVATANLFTMGFCVGCHKRNGVSHDCLVCHR
jgi:hypothetical protein